MKASEKALIEKIKPGGRRVRSAYSTASRDNLVKQAGYQAFDHHE